MFDAKASVADFQGRTETAVGELSGGAAVADTRGWVEVRWQDIDTKNGTRNRHMLRTVDDARYPLIRFELQGADSVRSDGDSAMAVLRGTLSLHGETRQVAWAATVWVRPDSVAVSADFPLDIRDYGIKPPVRFIIARMGAVVQVHVRLVFVAEKTQPGA